MPQIAEELGLSHEGVRRILKKRGITGKTRRRQIDIENASKADQTYFARFGHDWPSHKRLLTLGKEMMRNGIPRERTPISAFGQQRQSAKHRGIEWKLNLAEWWHIWEISGKWDMRGRGHAGWVMSRYADIGPYAIGNVFIQPADENNREYMTRVHEQHKTPCLCVLRKKSPYLAATT